MYTCDQIVGGWVLLVLSVLLLAGCEGKGTVPDVPAGKFTLYIDGIVSDTLSGPAHYRMDEGALVGIELGPEGGTGVSIELEPHPPELRTYEVVEWELFTMERPGSAPGVVGFLTMDDARYETTDGVLELTYVDEEQIGATFTFQMDGEEISTGDMPSLEVTGVLNAPSSQ